MTQPIPQVKVGFIGLGNMGIPMAKNVLKKGFQLIVWNRTLSKAEEFKGLGAEVASNPKEVAERSDIIITMVASPSAVEQVVMGTSEWPGLIDGISAGKIVVDMTTNLPSVSIKLAQEVKKKGGEMLDAPVVGSVRPATEGTLTIIVGGKKEALEKARPVLEAMGKKVIHVGENGTGCIMKLFLNTHIHTMMVSYAESLALGRKAGLDTATMQKVISETVFKNYISDLKGPKIVGGDYKPLFTVELMAKDMELALELGKELKVPLPLLSAARDVTYATISFGNEKLDNSAVALAYEKLGNLKFKSE